MYPYRDCAVNGRTPGRRWILGRGLRGGGPGRPPCWRTLKESCKGLGSVSLKNKQPTHTVLLLSLSARRERKDEGQLAFRATGSRRLWDMKIAGFGLILELLKLRLATRLMLLLEPLKFLLIIHDLLLKRKIFLLKRKIFLL
jgi:hypothetical protein